MTLRIIIAELNGTKIFAGTRVNIKWKEVWYDGTVIKLGPVTDLVKVSKCSFF